MADSPNNLTKESVLLLAPDDKSIKAAEGLAAPDSWLTLGRTENVLWGLCKGSGPQPYQTQVDLKSSQLECNCPSRKRPCKHALALALLYAENAHAISEEAVPGWVTLLATDALSEDVPGTPFPDLPKSWQPYLADEFTLPYMQELGEFLVNERARHTVYPPHDEVFTALELTPYDSVKVLILGQDPYHGPGQAHGLSFSVQPGISVPPSLRNIYKELEDDLSITPPSNGFLKAWAEQGVLMLNAVLTVRRAQANAHKDKGWELFTDTVIKAVNQKEERVVFVLWGNYAQKKRKLIDETRHSVVASAHPSPLSARNGFFGSRPFSKINELLKQAGREPIDWSLDEVPF